jgi:hypothetical protein
MDYQYETLLDERFQMLCQSLIVREFRGVQCFPVGMPDGGRDATASDTSGRIVFQVKYARNPATVADPVKWVTSAIDGEVEKVKRLAERGATSFVLLTNMPGTSHLDTGRMDKVQAHLDSVMPIPGACWWRDDLDRRLDLSYDLKLKYPSLLSGSDLVRLLWESTGIGEDRRRRADALQSYFTDQSDRDSKVRFKQADLSPSPLFDLFIDVPAMPRRNSKHRDTRSEHYKSSIISILREEENEEGILLYQQAEYQAEYQSSVARRLVRRGLQHALATGMPVGAAGLILSQAFGESVSKMVIEGAPGQGKSTFAQYIAQVNRARILRLESAADIPARDALSPLMLPFKLELRDLAMWLKGVDPWAGGESTQHGGPRTLEGALAAHIARYSGGVRFDVSDLLFVMSGNSVLIILDALDEVAGLDDRQQVVDEVTAAAKRLEGRSEESQIKFVITSRPTAIAGSPTFDGDEYFYLTLAPIHRSLAMEYTEKWARARNLDDVDLAMLTSTLEEKLRAPHMAELAKNTMQLSILLSLTHLRGSTLPDKRTELYDAYIDVFLNREAEKDRTVRENRELLVNIHRFLGYYLHAQAEVGGGSGRISTDELRQVLTTFLMQETAGSHFMQQRVTELIDSLLTGVVERIVALVSRVEGTYEFEVQPLREYFAAKYLYETAPYAPATRKLSGTKPERFDGIARNPYWMNVTRFFAGCFSMGELLDLADRTARLIEESDPADAAYPRTLALCLMQDWVFTQSSSSMKRIVEAVFDKPGVRWAAVRDEQVLSAYGGEDTTDVALSPSAGYENLVDHFWPMVTGNVHRESLAAVCALLQQQPEKSLVTQLWYAEGLKKSAAEIGEWCVVGNWLGVFTSLRIDHFNKIIGSLSGYDRELALVAFAEAGGDIDQLLLQDKSQVVAAILNGVGRKHLKLKRASKQLPVLTLLDPLFMLRCTMDPNLSAFLFENFSSENSRDSNVDVYANIVECVGNLAHPDRINQLELWAALTESIRSTFGRTWREYELANLAASVKNPLERGAGADKLFDETRTAPDRIRNARRRARQPEWWRKQYDSIRNTYDRGLWVLAAYSWAHPDTLVALIDEIDKVAQEIDEFMYAALLESCASSRNYGRFARATVHLESSKLNALHWRTISIIHNRLAPEERIEASRRFLRSRSRDFVTGATFLDHFAAQVWSGSVPPEESVKLLAQGVRRGLVSSHRRFYADSSARKMSSDTRSLIIKGSWEMPATLLAAVHTTPDTRRRFTPVMKIAESQGWFAH